MKIAILSYLMLELVNKKNGLFIYAFAVNAMMLYTIS
jgi:hypothetical protein